MAGLPVFLINLDRDAERLARMAEQLAAAALSFVRVPAVIGAAVPEHLCGYLLTASGEIASKLKRGEVGCYASHLLIHSRISTEEAAQPVLVLEDDLRFASDLADVVAKVIEMLPADWDIVRLSNPPKSAYVPVAQLGGARELVRYSKIPNNTGAYLINPRGAAKFLAGPKPRMRAIDEDLRRPWNFGLKTYGVLPPPIVSNIFDSSIDAMEDRGLRPRAKPPKMLTGRTEGLIGGIRRMRYNMSDLGVRVWLRCLLRNATRALAARMWGKAVSADRSVFRVEGSRPRA
jgi:glycosyl transferase, family 25